MPFLPGFDERWKDVPDCILGITKDIWEDRGIHTLHRYYGPELVVRSPASVIKGNSGIIAATEATLAGFPDRQLQGEDVIWCATGDDSFLSSHRIYCTATHEGPGMFGAPTGAEVYIMAITHAEFGRSDLRREWTLIDETAIWKQILLATGDL